MTRAVLATWLLLVLLAACAAPAPTQGPPMTQEAAEAAAKTAAPEFADAQVMGATLASWADLGDQDAPHQGAVPAGADLVWRISLGRGPLSGPGVTFVLDAHDGRVIQRTDWIS